MPPTRAPLGNARCPADLRPDRGGGCGRGQTHVQQLLDVAVALPQESDTDEPFQLHLLFGRDRYDETRERLIHLDLA
jgi:hypothetical protein